MSDSLSKIREQKNVANYDSDATGEKTLMMRFRVLLVGSRTKQTKSFISKRYCNCKLYTWEQSWQKYLNLIAVHSCHDTVLQHFLRSIGSFVCLLAVDIQ